MKHEPGLNSSLVGELGTYQIETTIDGPAGQVVTKVLREGKVADLQITTFDRTISAKALAELVQKSHDAKLAEFTLLLKIAHEVAALQRAELFVKVGVMFMRRGLYDEAEHCYQQAIVLQKNLVSGYVNLARLYQRRGAWEDARRTLVSALALAPSYADIHHGLGLCYSHFGEARAAESEFEKALQVNPRFARALFDLALLRIARAPTQAIDALRRATLLDPLYRGDAVKHGIELLAAGRHEEAAKVLTDFRDSFPDEDPLWVSDEFDLLVRFAEPGQRPLLADDYITAINARLAEHPDWADLHNELGKVYLLAIKTYWDRAIAEFRRALLLNESYEAARKNFELAQYELKGYVLFLRGLFR